MTHDGTKRPGRFGLLVASLIMAILVLGVMDLWRWFRTHGRPGEASAVAPSHLIQQEDPQATGERAIEGTGPMKPAREAGSAPRDERDLRIGEHDAPSPWTAGSHPEPAGAAGGVDLTSRTMPGQGSSPPVPGEEDARHAVPNPALGTPGSVPSQGVLAAEAGVVSPEEKGQREKEPSAGNEDTSDRTPPILRQLRFEPGVIEGGGATTLTIEATDTLSGVKSVRGEIQSPSGKAVLPLYLQESHGGESFTYVLSIPPAAEAGIWFVKWLYLTDVADNSSLIQVASATTAPPGGTFSVSSSESDSIAPDVLEISFAKDVIEDEDRNVIRVEVRDDLSGVTAVAGTCQSPSKSAIIPFRCVLDEASGLWEGNVMIPPSADCGVWSVQQLSAKDKAGNTAQLTADSPILAHATFTVAPRANCDSSPPTLDAFVLSQTIVPGDVATEILLSAQVHDVGSGAASMTGWFEGPLSEGGQVPKNHFNCTPDPDNPEAPWTGKVLVPQFAPRGTWKVRVIRLEDKALNVREYTPADPVLSGGVFEVR